MILPRKVLDALNGWPGFLASIGVNLLSSAIWDFVPMFELTNFLWMCAGTMIAAFIFLGSGHSIQKREKKRKDETWNHENSFDACLDYIEHGENCIRVFVRVINKSELDWYPQGGDGNIEVLDSALNAILQSALRATDKSCRTIKAGSSEVIEFQGTPRIYPKLKGVFKVRLDVGISVCKGDSKERKPVPLLDAADKRQKYLEMNTL